jgi:hypothetical protein
MSSFRNPPWTREEAILALDVFMEGPTDERIHALSAYLRSPGFSKHIPSTDSYRNFDGVKRRMNEFERLQRGDAANVRPIYVEVWSSFVGKREQLRAEAAAIHRRSSAWENLPS